MKVGVTGGAGFIGGHVVDELERRGHEAVIFDHLGRTIRDVPVLMGDVRDKVAMTELAAHVDGIIHLAACLGTQETIKNPLPAVMTNVEGGLNFLEAITQYDLPGTYIAVGNHWMNNSYSISKTTVERFCHMFRDERGTRVNSVRVVNAYGPRQSVAAPYGAAKVRKITPAFVCRALTGADIEVYGDGQQISDMVHVTDAAKVLVEALEAAAQGLRVTTPVEVGPDDHLTVLQVAQLISQAAQDLGFEPVGIKHLPMRPGEIPGAKVTADTHTLGFLGMSAADFIPAGQGLADTVKWFAQNWLPGYQAAQKKKDAPAKTKEAVL